MFDKYNGIKNDGIRVETKEITLKEDESQVIKFDFQPNCFICSLSANTGNNSYYARYGISTKSPNINENNYDTYDLMIDIGYKSNKYLKSTSKAIFSTPFEENEIYITCFENQFKEKAKLKIMAFNFPFKPELYNQIAQNERLSTVLSEILQAIANQGTNNKNIENILSDILEILINQETNVNVENLNIDNSGIESRLDEVKNISESIKNNVMLSEDYTISDITQNILQCLSQKLENMSSDLSIVTTHNNSQVNGLNNIFDILNRYEGVNYNLEQILTQLQLNNQNNSTQKETQVIPFTENQTVNAGDGFYCSKIVTASYSDSLKLQVNINGTTQSISLTRYNEVCDDLKLTSVTCKSSAGNMIIKEI